ncbi:MAG TPA: oligosaccharide flippase family protein [Thermoleophilaceae bacterium]|nr:oligosaccharide flippase family protein [Thermoleophilaceae bacterium]
MSDARRLATGSLAQQAAQVTGLVAMLAIFVVLARQLSLAELGVYGLLNALAGYLLIVQNAAAGAAVRAMAAAPDASDAGAPRAAAVAPEPGQGSIALSTAAMLYVAAGAACGLLLAGLGVALAEALDLSPALARQARLGALAAGAVTFVGWPLTVYRDALRARGRFVLAAGTETVALIVYMALVLGLAVAGAPLWAVVGAGAAIPLLAGVGCALVAGVVGLPWRLRPRLASRATARELLGLAGYISLSEAASAAVYVLTRVVLGISRSPATVGLYEGPVRAHNLVRALNAAVTVTVLPTAAGYQAAGDDRRLRELLLRGSRYTLALIVPIAVVGMVLAGPILGLLNNGDSDFRPAGSAMAILLAHWTLNGMSGVAAAMLVALGGARDLARWALLVASSSVALALVLVPWLGLDGAALATTLSYVALFPYLVRVTLRAVPVSPGELARRAFAPAWTLGAALAAGLAAVRLTLDPETVPGVVAAALGGLAAYWVVYYLVCFDGEERDLVRQMTALPLRSSG